MDFLDRCDVADFVQGMPQILRRVARRSGDLHDFGDRIDLFGDLVTCRVETLLSILVVELGVRHLSTVQRDVQLLHGSTHASWFSLLPRVFTVV